MKSINIHVSAVFALLLGLAACNKTEPENKVPDQTGVESAPVVFTATGLNSTATTGTTSTRATVDGNWEGVTSVAVMMDGTVKEYSVTATDVDNTSATLSSDDPHYWSSNYDDITVTAWWPYTEGETTMPEVVVQADQSTSDSFEGSDFISAENQTVTYGSPTLTFTHRTARVIVKLEPGDGITGVANATVRLMNLSTNNGNPSKIKAYNTSDASYEALTAPQTVAAGNNFIQVELDGGIFYFSPQNNVVLDAGKRYTYTIKVNLDGLTLEGSTINDWTDGGSDSGEAEVLYTYDSETNTYTVYSVDGLLAWNEAAQSDRSLNCTLASDIDLTNQAWTPVGDYSNPYTGTFEGGDHSITGLTINTSSAYAGLIGRLGSGGRVQNLTLENVDITSSSNSVGGVAGFNYAGTITACHVSGSVSGSSYYVGGVVGSVYPSATVIACSSSVSVSGTGVYVGGVTGNNYAGTVTACYSTGSVSGNNYVGGVMGLNESGTVTACYSSGNVSGNNVGGVLGYNNSGTVTACYWGDYEGNGIGSGNGEATEVDGTEVTWSDAVEGMNAVLTTSDWQYELLEGNTLPTLKKNQ